MNTSLGHKPSNSTSPETRLVVGTASLALPGAEVAISATTDSLDDIFSKFANCRVFSFKRLGPIKSAKKRSRAKASQEIYL
jgi:hypothetical protein